MFLVWVVVFAMLCVGTYSERDVLSRGDLNNAPGALILLLATIVWLVIGALLAAYFWITLSKKIQGERELAELETKLWNRAEICFPVSFCFNRGLLRSKDDVERARCRVEVLNRMRYFAMVAGKAAIAQEHGYETASTDTQMQQATLDMRVQNAKRAWGEAMEILRVLEPDLAKLVPHWSKAEPYASFKAECPKVKQARVVTAPSSVDFVDG